jgi:hypothetical protein
MPVPVSEALPGVRVVSAHVARLDGHVFLASSPG